MTALQIRMRPDLILASHGRDQQRYWVVEDPVTLKFFRLRDEECSILQMLDGRATLDGIKEAFERRFAPLRLSVGQLHAFLFRLHEFGLIVGDVAGQGGVLSQRNQSRAWNTRFAALVNPLAIRLPGLPARRVIDWLYPRCRWIYSRTWLVVWSALVVAALGLVLAEFATFQARLPGFWEFFGIRTAAWFAIALIGVKTLHELGHALMCRHFGAQSREIGVMFLVLMPTLYCDVSDAWRIESKWQRILISAAGMLVELVLASVATLLWWFSEPGLLNAICLRVMFLCSVSTLLFNANPLVRCDGYYILSDLVEVPNLWQESRALWRRAVWSWLTGRPLADDPTIPRRLYPWLMLYSALSTAYCWLLVVGILWFCFTMLQPHGLSFVAWGLVTIVLAGLAAPPLRSLHQMFSAPHERRLIRRGRATLAVLTALAAIALAAFVPLPYSIPAPLWLEAADAQAVYVSVPGTLTRAAHSGTSIEKGESLAELANPEIELQVASLTDEVKSAEVHLKNLRLLLSDDATISPLIPAEEKSLEDAQQRLAQWQRDQARLTLRAPAAGTVLPPPILPPRPDSKRLPGWRGTPLDPQNRGCCLEMGTLVCQIGDPHHLEAILVVEQSYLPMVRPGQRVRLRIDQTPAAALPGRVIELAKTDADQIPSDLAHALDLPLKRGGEAGARQAKTYYQARVELDSKDAPLLVGMTGQAKIVTDWQPLAQRFFSYLRRTFRVG